MHDLVRRLCRHSSGLGRGFPPGGRCGCSLKGQNPVHLYVVAELQRQADHHEAGAHTSGRHALAAPEGVNAFKVQWVVETRA